jgi:predicted small lipoprotein YifL
MKKTLTGLVLLALVTALTGCRNKNEDLYGPSLTRAQAETHLQAIIDATSGSAFNKPTAYTLKRSSPFFALIIVVNRVDTVTYSPAKSYYLDQYGDDSYWAYLKDDQMIEAKSVLTTSSDSASTSASTRTSTYSVTNDTFTQACDAMRPKFAPYPDTVVSNAISSRPKDILAGLKEIDAGNGTLAGTSSVTYSVIDEEYRSQGDDNLYLSYTKKPSDKSSSTRCTYVFKDYLIQSDHEKQTIIDDGYDFTWGEPSISYPDLSTFTKN